MTTQSEVAIQSTFGCAYLNARGNGEVIGLFNDIYNKIASKNPLLVIGGSRSPHELTAILFVTLLLFFLKMCVSYRLSGGTPWRYDGKASCMSKQAVTLLYWFWRPA